MKLVIGNKKYSSWSLRPWLVLKQAGIPFEEIQIRIHRADSYSRIRRYSPGGRVPVLIDGRVRVWESLAICEYLAEKFPRKKLWPAGVSQRARARSVANEMHAGFMELRKNLPMDCSLKTKFKKIDPLVLADIARIQEIWSDGLKASGGPFLFGDFTIADALFAPVCLRFESYGIPLKNICLNYKKRILTLSALREWVASGIREPDLGQ